MSLLRNASQISEPVLVPAKTEDETSVFSPDIIGDKWPSSVDMLARPKKDCFGEKSSR